jgi:hypothetical protein
LLDRGIIELGTQRLSHGRKKLAKGGLFSGI